MYITKLVLNNIRGFGPEFTLHVADDNGAPRLRTVLIGKNGTCKTTLLRCLALGICWREDANALIAEPIGPMIAQGQNKAEIVVTLRNPDSDATIEICSVLERRPKERRDYVAHQTGREALKNSPFVWGVGAGRSGEGIEPYRDFQIVDSVYSLFNYEQSSLISAELTIRRLKDFKIGKRGVYSKTISGIKRVLGLEPRARIRVGRAGGVFITSSSVGREVPIEAWADGYRLTTNWLLDAYAWAMRANAITQEGGIRGILLVDEIEQHIHPSLHTTLLTEIRSLFPEAQIFMTTHSPLTTLGAKPGELVSLQKSGTRVKITADVPDFRDWSADDMLENERTFDSSVYGPEMDRSIARYKSLAARPAKERSAKEAKELQKLARELAASRPAEEVSPLLKELMRLSNKFDL
jgi:hypothetical protein